MLTAEQAGRIRDMCRHPGASHWSDDQMAHAIQGVIDEPIPYRLVDEPIPYELSHDAVYEEIEE